MATVVLLLPVKYFMPPPRQEWDDLLHLLWVEGDVLPIKLSSFQAAPSLTDLTGIYLQSNNMDFDSY